ncbi:hypothetical protein DFH07DRAFT_1011604 [Mycena maculata]|uniref:Serum paraoxonase/arylesterase n=1 Tax=Mycena maculata TaxID=230809 RepID=A0AAD7HE27_9AGAR|nr:hypothetical protein DFH07DRAFT_1011604 [Mycena maculata]
MSRLYFPISVLLAVAAVVGYRLYPLLFILGLNGRVLEPLGNTDCITVPALPACEKIVLHAPTGVLYLACSSPESRAHWTPAINRLNASGPADDDFLATYAPHTGAIVRLVIEPPLPGGLSVHGMDVVPSADDPRELFIYAVNHRRPADAPDAASKIGADSTIEVFKTSVGSAVLTHLHTVRDPAIITPNDIAGSSNGREFFFTNDHASKTSLLRHLAVLGLQAGSVGYCDVHTGCKIAIPSLQGANGIARAPNNDTIFVGSALHGGIYVLERQADNALLKTHTIATDRPLDNLSVDEEGVVWAATFPYGLTMLKHIVNATLLSPASAHAVVRNTGPGSFYGEKFRVEKVFEDNGTVARGTTSVVHDAVRRRLFLHGISAPHLTVCAL